MAPQGAAAAPPPLAEHYARRQQLRNALTLVTSKANALHAGTDRPATHARAPILGVREERELKAEKWALASRAYAAREAVAKAKVANEAAANDLDAQRASLAARRANLSTARSLLTSLSSSSPSTSSLSLSDSLPALSARLSTLESSLAVLQAETTRVRLILARELLAVFALSPLERPLADPFLSFPSTTTSSRSAYPPTSAPSPFYTLATLPLPPLSALLSLPPTTLEALLAHLAHLARLLALYARVPLPYTPLPGAFGPGRAGVRAAPGWALEYSGSAGRRKAGGALGAEVWPLVFGSRKTRREAGAAAGRAEGDDPPSEGEDDLDARSERSSDASASLSAFSSSAGGAGPNTTKRGKRANLVLGGAVALALDFAFLAWTRDAREGRRRAWRVEELDDLGALVARAAGVVDENEGAAPALEPGQREDDPEPASFPLDLRAALAHYTALALGPTSAPSSQTGMSRAALEESGVVVEGADGEDEDEDEGWDLVSV
ncbi:hypothetical protein JCM10450v2_002593 [Rhodotorula kratochvilovae]